MRKTLSTFSTLALAGALALAAPAAARNAPRPTPASAAMDHMHAMAEQHAGDRPVATEAAATAPATEVAGEEVAYAEVGGKKVTGFLARPKNAKGPLPGLIVIHEWWGLNDNVRDMTRRLAGEGYAALAVDLYGGEVATASDAAMKLVEATMNDMPRATANLRQAHQYLEKQGAPRVGVIGWCFGGGWSLATAMLLPDQIDAAVIYYGRLETDPEKLAPLRMPVLGLFGGKDKGPSPEQVRAFEAAMKKLGKPVEVHIYEGADHAFANPSGGNYNAEAARDAWAKTVAFLEKNLKKG